MTITTQSPCSTFPSGNYSPGLQIFLTIREAMDVAQSAPQGAHYHADVIYLLP